MNFNLELSNRFFNFLSRSNRSREPTPDPSLSKFKSPEYKKWLREQLLTRMRESGVYDDKQLENKTYYDLCKLDWPNRRNILLMRLESMNHDAECTICLNEHIENLHSLVGLRCGHVYCEGCVKELSSHTDKCPNCRALVDTPYVRIPPHVFNRAQNKKKCK